ncbi:hypothetical protein HD806DRAFT_473413 [Xylariaceae sp. AK1471]|nr:hypothetical protein HD806DRAFT_473413 [Xylariaceae sp. AK1471]
MHFISAIALLVGAVMSHPAAAGTDAASFLFDCKSSNTWGYSPKCCLDINGQVGINCIGAHQMGITNPTFECNLFVYNITGCCQSTGYKNPFTNYTLDLCAMSTDPI